MSNKKYTLREIHETYPDATIIIYWNTDDYCSCVYKIVKEINPDKEDKGLFKILETDPLVTSDKHYDVNSVDERPNGEIVVSLDAY
ncbi:MAG: hypothetical protein IJ523_09310 [Succinivibrionaceae bacterium]|nr:hypothetical protein [Succinivibrionaceae bacterium]